LAVDVGLVDIRRALRRKWPKSQKQPPAHFLRIGPSMTQPRCILQGSTVMVTRRTIRRYHLFRPDPAIRKLYLYTLAVCAREFGVLVHGVTLMSTHEHLVLTDTQRRLPDFLRRLHRLVSLGTKALRSWEGPTWDHERTSVVRLVTDAAVIEKLAYVAANPVAAGLVLRAKDWPGITVLPQELGRRTFVVERPAGFFNPDNPQWPDRIELTLTLPPSLERAYAPDVIRQTVGQELRRQENLARQRMRAHGKRVLGPERVRRLSPYRRATTFEPLRGRDPTFAVGRGQKSVFFKVMAQLRGFRRAYRIALEQWRAGHRSVVFPQGTWEMCRAHGAIAQL
jgi:putative transposase